MVEDVALECGAKIVCPDRGKRARRHGFRRRLVSETNCSQGRNITVMGLRYYALLIDTAYHCFILHGIPPVLCVHGRLRRQGFRWAVRAATSQARLIAYLRRRRRSSSTTPEKRATGAVGVNCIVAQGWSCFLQESSAVGSRGSGTAIKIILWSKGRQLVLKTIKFLHRQQQNVGPLMWLGMRDKGRG